ncbi:MAG: NAD(+) synthase [Elusimicrobia bacterium CG03_land_8_20_14_0_80_50_18]|nr:MAG: NAD(+) synthase [Elusimicrobia bacterium CG03_land_8_20_14_0_80_50_18]
MKPMEKKIISWLRKKLKSSHCAGFVLGLSGGVDSAVAAVLAHKASRGKTMALILPCESLREDIEDARKFARKFKIPFRVIDLTKIYLSALKACPVKSAKTARGNLKARLRMSAIYYFANSKNYLVTGTSNKTELKFGYFTKYGDGAADVLPLAELLKKQVRELAAKLDIPKAIIDKAPSAGLWPGQSDEQEIGLTYGIMDQIARAGKIPAGITPAQKKRAKEMLGRAVHKLKFPDTYKIR